MLIVILNENYKTSFIISDFYSGYYKIHPILFYLGMLYLYIYLIPKLFGKLKFYNILALLIISFSLGSLWALYQSIWGYYWSSDYIEIVLVYNILTCLSVYHTIKIKTKNNKNLALNTIIILLFLRLNLVYTKHSFFNNKLQIIYLLQFYLFSLLTNNLFPTKNYILNLKTKDIVLITIFFIIILNKYNLKILQNTVGLIWTFSFLFFLLKILNLQKNKTIHLIFFIITFIFINIKFHFFIKFFIKTPRYFISNLAYYYNFKNIKINIWKNYLNLLKFKYNWKYNYFEIKNINTIYFTKTKQTSIINYI